MACFEDPDFFDKYNRATWVVEQNGFKRIIEGSAWVLGSIVSLVLLVFYLISIDPFLLIFILCPVKEAIISRISAGKLEQLPLFAKCTSIYQNNYTPMVLLLCSFLFSYLHATLILCCLKSS